jgi:hypothetical protein
MGGESGPATPGVVDSTLEPNEVLWFEPLEARELSWLPLAVRYKLDRSGIRLSLGSWRSLELDARRRLVACREGDDFAALVRTLAAADVRESPAIDDDATFSDYVHSKTAATRSPTPHEDRPATNISQMKARNEL